MTIVREAHFYGDQLGDMKRYIDAAKLLYFDTEIRLEESTSEHMGYVLKIDVIDPRVSDYGIGVPLPEEPQDFVEVRTVGVSESQRKPV